MKERIYIQQVKIRVASERLFWKEDPKDEKDTKDEKTTKDEKDAKDDLADEALVADSLLCELGRVHPDVLQTLYYIHYIYNLSIIL